MNYNANGFKSIWKNLWGILSRDVYKNVRQFNHLDDLKEAIVYSWERIPLSMLKSLVKSIPKRLLAAAEKKGSETEY